MNCPSCGKQTVMGGKCIDCLLAAIPWKEGDTVRVKSTGETGTVVYRYYNGFTMVNLGKKITGGMLNNDGTHANDDLELVT